MGILDWAGGLLFSGEGKFRGQIEDLIKSGKADKLRGMGLSDEALGLIRSSINDYQNRLSSGEVLPASVQRAYDLALGRTRDTATRAIAANKTGLRQARLAGGGMMSAEAEAEYQRLGERDALDSEYQAETGLEISRSRDELSSVRDLMDRLDNLKGTILNYGQFSESLAQQEYIQGVLSKIDRRKAMTTGAIGGMNAVSRYGGFSNASGGDGP